MQEESGVIIGMLLLVIITFLLLPIIKFIGQYINGTGSKVKLYFIKIFT